MVMAQDLMGYGKDFCLRLQLANFSGEMPGDKCFQLCWPDSVAAIVILLSAAEQKPPVMVHKWPQPNSRKLDFRQSLGLVYRS